MIEKQCDDCVACYFFVFPVTNLVSVHNRQLIISRSIAQLSSTSAPAFPPSFLSQNSPINYLEFNSMIVWIASLFPVLLNMSIWLPAPTRPITVNRLELWHLYLLTYLPGLSSTDHHHRHHEWRLVIIATSSYSPTRIIRFGA